MSKVSKAFLPVACLVAAGCGSAWDGGRTIAAQQLFRRMVARPPDNELTKKEAVCEVVLHFMVSMWDTIAQGLPRKKKVYAFYLAIEGEDPI